MCTVFLIVLQPLDDLVGQIVHGIAEHFFLLLCGCIGCIVAGHNAEACEQAHHLSCQVGVTLHAGIPGKGTVGKLQAGDGFDGSQPCLGLGRCAV